MFKVQPLLRLIFNNGGEMMATPGDLHPDITALDDPKVTP